MGSHEAAGDSLAALLAERGGGDGNGGGDGGGDWQRAMEEGTSRMKNECTAGNHNSKTGTPEGQAGSLRTTERLAWSITTFTQMLIRNLVRWIRGGVPVLYTVE
jgi:hypothetical protein